MCSSWINKWYLVQRSSRLMAYQCSIRSWIFKRTMTIKMVAALLNFQQQPETRLTNSSCLCCSRQLYHTRSHTCMQLQRSINLTKGWNFGQLVVASSINQQQIGALLKASSAKAIAFYNTRSHQIEQQHAPQQELYSTKSIKWFCRWHIFSQRCANVEAVTFTQLLHWVLISSLISCKLHFRVIEVYNASLLASLLLCWTRSALRMHCWNLLLLQSRRL